MDTTVSGIGAVVVAELRAAGYMESTVGQYAKTIKALTEFALGRGYSTSLGAEFASMTTSVRTGRFSPQRRFEERDCLPSPRAWRLHLLLDVELARQRPAQRGDLRPQPALGQLR